MNLGVINLQKGNKMPLSDSGSGDCLWLPCFVLDSIPLSVNGIKGIKQGEPTAL
jgi:hypothetical protein